MLKSPSAPPCGGARLALRFGEIALDDQITQENTPIFQRIKDFLLAGIAAGRWKEGDVIPSEQKLFHSLIVHFENAVPIQVEDRWVNPACAPDYLAQDFATITPNEYLMAAAPLQGATYSIEALSAPRNIAEMLAIDMKQACLVLRRQTRSDGKIASIATMWHPGHRYQFAGSFS